MWGYFSYLQAACAMTEDTFSSNNCANTVLASLFFANKNNANNILGPSCWKEDHNNFV